MKRGYTKPFNRGQTGQDQRSEKGRREAIKWHANQGNYARIDELLEKWKNR